MNFKIPKNKYVSSVTIGEKGQIVIPKAVRDMFSLAPGDSLVLLADLKRGIALVDYEKFAPKFEDHFAEENDE